MAILVGANEVRKSFGVRPLFEGLTFVIEEGERIGLIGPNGAGKSTLMKILAGKMEADGGDLSLRKGIRIGYLEQVPTLRTGATVEETVLEALKDPHDWEAVAFARECLSKLHLEGSLKVDELSGGWRKRTALARELAREPDLLLLDEPTNHLDIESILWLEEFLAKAKFATLTITHDRLFLQKVSTKILELDRKNPGGLLKVDGDYTTYLELKDRLISAQEQQETSLRNKLRRETEWLRRGPKARTTKQQARIQSAETLGDQVKELEYRNQKRTTRLDFQSTDKKPKRLIEAKKISKSYGGKKVFSNVDVFIGPGSRVGLLGANGCGKSTLIRTLLRMEEPDSGEILQSDHLKVAYFEQNRETLDPNVSLYKTLCPHGDHVNFRGTLVHVRGYADRFLFNKEQMDVAVGKLSGGEQSRILVAKLMLKDANVLVLDEPTNDLDIETLDVLEACLQDFDGAVLLVTHDRYFLDQVATQILAFGENGVETFAGLSQWETWFENQKRATPAESPKEKLKVANRAKKLSYNEQRELDSMEKNIQSTESELEKLVAESESEELRTNVPRLKEIFEAISTTQTKIEKLYERWAELEKMKADSGA